jgi:anti-sigma B factor antagonist
MRRAVTVIEPQRVPRRSVVWTTDAEGMTPAGQQADFKISTSDIDGPTVVRMEGELDSFSAAQVREELAGAVAYEATIIDMREVAFVDSAGLGALVGGLRRIREAGRGVALCCPRPSVRRLLAMTGVDRLVPIADSPTEARTLVAEQ